MHLIFCQGITMSLFCENIFKNLLFPGTIIDVMVARLIVVLFYGTMICVIFPVSKSAHTSCTYPNLLPSLILITSLCLKSKPFSCICNYFLSLFNVFIFIFFLLLLNIFKFHSFILGSYLSFLSYYCSQYIFILYGLKLNQLIFVFIFS